MIAPTREAKEKWRVANLVKMNGYRIKSLYGITLDQKNEMFAEQGGSCKICKTPFGSEKKYLPHIDHDHATGKVRGLLCDYCNRGLGAFKDNIESLKNAISYLLASR